MIKHRISIILSRLYMPFRGVQWIVYCDTTEFNMGVDNKIIICISFVVCAEICSLHWTKRLKGLEFFRYCTTLQWYTEHKADSSIYLNSSCILYDAYILLLSTTKVNWDFINENVILLGICDEASTKEISEKIHEYLVETYESFFEKGLICSTVFLLLILYCHWKLVICISMSDA